MDMNGKDYERQIAGYLRTHGFRRVRLTGNSGDYGVDIVAHKRRHKYAVQCKFYSKPVGVAAVQQVVGGMAFYDCDRALVITNNTFTRQARELADRNGVELMDNLRSSGRLRNALLFTFILLSFVLLLFTEYRVFALCGIAAMLFIFAFMKYLRFIAVRDKHSGEG